MLDRGKGAQADAEVLVDAQVNEILEGDNGDV